MEGANVTDQLDALILVSLHHGQPMKLEDLKQHLNLLFYTSKDVNLSQKSALY